MTPIQSYRIWFTPRSGSTLLCKGLEETGIAGKPGEFFTLFEHNSLCDKYGAKSYTELKNKLWAEGTSSNGIFGIKIINDEKVINEIRHLRQASSDEVLPNGDFLSDIFPNCKDIYLTRRDKIRQAVSWWKAIKDNVWHVKAGQKKQFNNVEFYDKNYDFAALSHLFKEATWRESAIQECFLKFNIKPLTIVYEEMIIDFENTIRQIIRYLELEDNQLQIKDMYYQKTADVNSEKWVQRFREDLKKELGK